MRTSKLNQSQLGIYLDSAFREDTAYVLAFVLGLKVGIEAKQLKRALEMSIACHPALKSAIISDANGEVRMEWDDNGLPDIPVKTMSEAEFNEYKAKMVRHIDIPGPQTCYFEIIQSGNSVWLAMQLHHIAFDGSSMTAFMHTLNTALEGDIPRAETLSCFDFAEREAAARTGAEYESQRDYYVRTFGDYDADGASIYADAKGEPGLSRKVYTLNTSLSAFKGGAAVANAAMGITLGAFTGRDDVLFTTAYHGRKTSEMANTVGMFVRTLPVRCHIGRDVTVADLISEMKQQRGDTRAKDLMSFGDFVRMTGYKQEVLFGYQGHILNYEPLSNVLSCQRIDKGETGLPLTFEMYLTDTGIEIDAAWRSDMYSESAIDRFTETFDHVLAQLLNPANQQSPVTGFSLMDEVSEERLMHIESVPALDFDRTVPIEGVVARVAREIPEKTAVVTDDSSYTYAEIDRLSTVMARQLEARGVCPGMTVGVMIPRSEWMVLIPLAVMKTGAAYMPLDPTFPEERLAFMTEDASVSIIVTVGSLADKVLPSFGGKILDAAELANEDSPRTDRWAANPGSPFVVLYTSGSTGKPKGVTLTRANILNYCHDYIKIVALGTEDRVPAYANFGFDAHMMDIYPTLMSGATLYILGEEIRHDLDAMHDFFVKNEISAAFLTTQIAWQMITLYEFPSLRWLSCGGEKLPPTGKQPFRFANVYGPTECTVIATYYLPQGDTDGSVIGRPIPGYELRVLDRHGRRVPQGVPGELVILGVGVGVGYLNRPELTAEKFITIDGERAYRTGDLVRWNEDGDLRFIGRMDGMVKMRGLRIELGEIEAVATRHEAVRLFVAAVKTVGGNEQLIGYYAVKEGRDVEPDQLREFMSADLTEFMIPTALIKLDKLPMTPNGKVDRKALPVPDIGVAEEMIPAATDDEKEMSKIVAGVLGHESFGVTTNLLKVGLTSLLAMRLVATIAKQRNVRLTSKAAMADPTVRGLIKALEAESREARGKSQELRGKRKYYPITENQRGVLIDWERYREALQYNIARAIKIKSDTDIDRLKKAIQKTVKAHPALDTRFVNRNGDIMQQRLDHVKVNIGEIVLDHEPSREDMQSLMRPFDLFNEPLYRFVIVHHGDDAWLFMDFHHIVFDGMSAMVFFESLSKAYAGQELPVEEYSAFEWADDEAAMLRSAEYEEAETWFEKLLNDTETTVYSHSSVAEPVVPGTLLRVSCEMEAADVDKFCKDNAVTPSNFFLSSFIQTLHRITRNETVAITTVNNGRSDVRLVDDIGFFVKTLPVVSRMSPKQAAVTSPANMTHDLQEQFNTTRGVDFYPFTEIVRKFGLRPEIMYVYEGGVSLDAADGPLADENIAVALDTAKVPLTLLIFTPAPGKYRLELEYDASLYSNADMSLLLDMVCTAAAGNTSAATVKDAVLLSTAQEIKLKDVRDGESGEVEYSSYHGAFELQADAKPDATALIACDRTLTFAEFDAEANRIANALRAKGVDRGDKVVVLLPRDSRLITAIYGVMKAGAAYIPCDPEYPVERIRLITEDSDARCIITTSDKLASYPGKAVDIDSLLQCADTARPGVEVHPDDPAYLIYTSGSTGRPKGVVIHHGAVTNYLYGYRKLIYEPMGADEPKVNMLIVTISFDASHVDLGTSLTSGHTLVIADEEECKDVTLLAELMKRTGVEAFDATPSRLAAMLELPEFCEAIAECKLLNIGGEAIPASLLSKLDAAGFKGLTINEYGPTETTVGSNHAVLQSDKAVTVGPPFYNYREYICDAWGGELPMGATGELVIAGRSVGKGYPNLPEKTAESFIIFKGEKAYRTGDLARWLPDGDVDVLGRIDHQVKLRGLRIELGEIESVANAFPGVKMSVANVCKIQNVDHLCIWYEGPNVNQDELRAHLSRHLTDYMVPDSFNPVDKIPVTPNGKLDRKHLPEPVLEKLAEYVEPAPGDESTIAEAFRRTLSLERVGADDDFFKIGGTSINAIKVVAVLAQSGLKISYKDLFATKTPRLLAAHIANHDKTPAPVAPSAPVSESVEEFGEILRKNSIEAFNKGERQAIGNVLLTGATGFLGVHILHWLLDTTDAKITCVVRGSAHFDASSRVRTLLFYYFGDTYEHLWNKRIFIITGDLTEASTLAALDAEVINTVINCAASVKHFAPGNEIEHANVDTVRNIVEWCSAHRRRLVHISTVSVAGRSCHSRTPDADRTVTRPGSRPFQPICKIEVRCREDNSPRHQRRQTRG